MSRKGNLGSPGTTQAKPMSDAHIHAFVDRQLKHEREEKLQELVSVWPEKYEQVQEYQIINERLVEGLADLFDQPIPTLLVNLLNSADTAADTGNRGESSESALSVDNFLKSKSKLPIKTKSAAKPKAKEPKPKEPKPKEPKQTESVTSTNNISEPPTQKTDSKNNSTLNTITEEDGVRTLNLDLPQRYAVKIIFGYFTTATKRIKNLITGKAQLTISIFLGVVIGWAAHESLNASASSTKSVVAQSAIDAHVFYTSASRHAVEVSAKKKKHLRNWIKNSLDSSLDPVNLAKFNYKLLGGRVLPLRGKLAGQYMYQHKKDKSRLTIYMSNYLQDNLGDSPQCEKIEGPGNATLSVCGWQKNNIVFYVIAKLSTKNIKNVSERIKKLMPKKKKG